MLIEFFYIVYMRGIIIFRFIFLLIFVYIESCLIVSYEK